MSQQQDRTLGATPGSMLPPIAGLAFSSASQSSLFDPGVVAAIPVDHLALAGSCVVCLAVGAATISRHRLSKQIVHWSSFIAIHIAGISALVLTILSAGGINAPALGVAFCKMLCLAGSTVMSFYWMRKLRGTASSVVAGTALAALAAGELIAFACSLNDIAAYTAVFILSFAQFAPMQVSRRHQVLSDFYPALSETYFGASEQRFSSRGYLAAAAMGICCIAVPLGMGLAFPRSTMPEPAFLPALSTTLITTLVAVAGAKQAWLEPERPLTTTAWIAMQLVCALGAILLAFGGTAHYLGISLVNVAALLLRAYVWYLSVAFLSFGERDPYFYTASGWVAMSLFALAGEALAGACTLWAPGNIAIMVALMGLFLLISAQIVFTQLLADTSRSAYPAAPSVGTGTAPQQNGVPDRRRTAAASAAGALGQATGANVTSERHIPLMDAMAVAPEKAAPLPSAAPDVHIATSVIELGQRFGLTGREIEVLTLYALGHTQARVSEELQLSQNTVHTHIKRIYDKTNLHSRQEILDYLSEYGG